MVADNNDHEILLIPSQNHASSVRSVISEHLFTLIGGICSPSVVDTDFTSNEVTLSDLCTRQYYLPPTESEANAIGVAGVVVVTTCCIDIVEVGSVGCIRRTKPPIVNRTNKESHKQRKRVEQTPYFCFLFVFKQVFISAFIVFHNSPQEIEFKLNCFHPSRKSRSRNIKKFFCGID